MSAAAAQPPSIPPRPTRSQEKDTMPRIPPRPVGRRLDRSVSPNSERYAPSPLNESLMAKSPRSSRLLPGNFTADPIDRSRSVDLPSLGEEGNEYANVAQEQDKTAEQNASPEHTRTVGDDLKLHAPKPSLPAVSAKQRVASVTRTDSDKAASYGIGRPSSEEPRLKKKASVVSQLSTSESHIDDEQGIPEIGKQVPMYPNAGDVQAPSPAPGATFPDSVKKHHSRRTSARGALPPGSYGLHGHGTISTDKLDKAYYEKHPDELKREHVHHHYDRANDFSMSSEALNKIVRDTVSRNGDGKNIRAFTSTPSEQVGWQAIEESTSRIASPNPQADAGHDNSLGSPLKQTFSHNGYSSDAEKRDSTIHVEERNHRRSVMFTDDENEKGSGDEYPILAGDEVAKGPSPTALYPAVDPPPERRGSAFEMEQPRSRPTSRPASIYRESPFEHQSTPLDDVQEYEPLFDEDEKTEKDKDNALQKVKSKDSAHRFPSRDIWEDAPNSHLYTAEVSTPDLPATAEISRLEAERRAETPAAAFARHQEELAEKELGAPDSYLHHQSQKPTWVQHKPYLAQEAKPVAVPERPSKMQRFPSRDVWEDTPDSLQLETTVSNPQQDEVESPQAQKAPQIPQRPARKMTDPKPDAEKSESSTVSPISPPQMPERPKPQIPARPVKAGPTSGGLEPAEAAAPPRQKPAVPARPVGNKIAALQAGFLSDLNKKIALGPQAPKKEDAASDEQETEEPKEKAPLVDARKARARGPQRRAPGTSPSPAVVPPEESKPAPSLGFSSCVTCFDIDPDEGLIRVVSGESDEAKHAESGHNEPASESSTAIPADDPEPATASSSTSPPPKAAATETLATNTAGESILEAQVDKKPGNQVEPRVVEETGGEAE